jgi:hypothetical protein
VRALYAKGRTENGAIVVGGWLPLLVRALFVLTVAFFIISITLFYLGKIPTGGIAAGISFSLAIVVFGLAKMIVGVTQR